MAVIKIMDEILANKIAAGEVVERCASVVKELTENSIDAKSTEIKIELKESGVKEIKVTDNGCGMDSDDAVMAFNRHATSKIIDEDDLYHIHTLGFRGEALASIASVSNIDLLTSKGDIGTHVNIKGGKVLKKESSDARKGTIISVKDLFYNTPARLKHLKSLYTELSNIVEYINKIALSHPEIRFTLINDDKEILRTDGSNNLLKCIKNIYGINIAKKMLEISSSNSDYEISGYISLPEVYRSNRNNIITIVNGRVVKNTELNRTINDSYHSYKPDNYYPIVVLNIKVDTTLVDVNIHPTKMDIKFGNIENLLELVENTIKDKLKVKTLIPHIEEKPTYLESYQEIKLDFDTSNKIYEDVEEYHINNDLTNTLNQENDNCINYDEPTKTMPNLYPVGSVFGTYIICQNEYGMYIIDQHAAKERINYEKVKEKLSKKTNKKIQMIFPLTIEYKASEFIILKENLEFLRELNFDIEEFGINSIIVKAYPTWIPTGNEDNAIKKVIELVIQKEKNFDLDKFNDNMAATMACKMSIKANTSLTIEEMENLISDLRKCNNPFNCPHGRPTTIYYSKNDAKEYSKIINKRLKIKLVILILFTLLSIFITIITISAIYKGFNVLPFLALFGASTFTSYLTINDYVDSKKEKKALDARDLDIHLNYAKKKLKRDTQILHKNQKHDKKTIEKLDLENSNLEERKKRKVERINELSILRNNVIKEFIRDNEKLDDTINIEYEKSNQKVKKINSDK